MLKETHCPLCKTADATLYFEDARRPYYLCGCCALVFVPPRCFLHREAERAEYLKHENDEHDAGYRQFLARLADPLTARLRPGALGLDFGCGPGPALALMLREQGYNVTLYDSFFAPDAAALNAEYDFIAATEVVEHLHRPAAELERLWQLLRPGGYMGLMTKLVIDRDAFARWHYKNDPTHVVFFSRETFEWWGAARGVRPEFIGADVILLRKQD
ncbi:MAG: class I SAM-dependent methyltransferase [Halioglobus sp.]|nr:class I SAM-dependent methyltransferase [Halioglobus sp.]